jgi:hypothetical protein
MAEAEWQVEAGEEAEAGRRGTGRGTGREGASKEIYRSRGGKGRKNLTR